MFTTHLNTSQNPRNDVERPCMTLMTNVFHENACCRNAFDAAMIPACYRSMKKKKFKRNSQNAGKVINQNNGLISVSKIMSNDIIVIIMSISSISSASGLLLSFTSPALHFHITDHNYLTGHCISKDPSHRSKMTRPARQTIYFFLG